MVPLDSLRRLHRRGRGFARAVALLAPPIALTGCDPGVATLDGQPAVYAEQDGRSVAEGGFGVMQVSGYDSAALGRSADDMYVEIRSSEASSCEALADGVASTPGFGWGFYFTLRRQELVPGTKLTIDPFTNGTIDVFRGGPDGWSGGGFACEDDPYDSESPITGEVLSVDDESVTLRIDNVCFIDYGPIVVEEVGGEVADVDDPSDDVLLRADGTYTIQRCGAAS
jgi:hypothetical protein